MLPLLCGQWRVLSDQPFLLQPAPQCRRNLHREPTKVLADSLALAHSQHDGLYRRVAARELNRRGLQWHTELTADCGDALCAADDLVGRDGVVICDAHRIRLCKDAGVEDT